VYKIYNVNIRQGRPYVHQIFHFGSALAQHSESTPTGTPRSSKTISRKRTALALRINDADCLACPLAPQLLVGLGSITN